MSQEDISRAVNRFGIYSGVRYLRNKGVPFEQAYFAVFGRKPTR